MLIKFKNPSLNRQDTGSARILKLYVHVRTKKQWQTIQQHRLRLSRAMSYLGPGGGCTKLFAAPYRTAWTYGTLVQIMECRAIAFAFCHT